MTMFSDLLSNTNIEEIHQPEVGDVFLINLTREEGIKPKVGDNRNKFYIVLGFDEYGNAYGGVVINSHVNQKYANANTEFTHAFECK